jgi:hypothetical protein
MTLVLGLVFSLTAIAKALDPAPGLALLREVWGMSASASRGALVAIVRSKY